ncbi:hypothetical protein [Sulfitobacter sp. LC.270.F.C4]|uniref:hypothetical protein n=1 Tax=Sulfitobacter sp. LC.270.F.C4 TaxID=3079556 RepID=UPI0029422A25|nr:hypothetical protein [Sulfitobacter sp. LC.270.F.C4]WOI16384.1 hypothetical protein R1T45_08400 [Sulfitobacter sp. LC.270.F.C4]
MTNSETPNSHPFEGTTKQSKAPTKADLMEIRSLYAQADAMAEAAEKPDDEDQPHAAAPPPAQSKLPDRQSDAG